MFKPYIRVAAGLIFDRRGRILLGQRPDGKAWPGWWEFPGGKIESGETVIDALTRELDEELGIQINTAYPWVTYIHEYPKNTVELNFCQVYSWQNEPFGREQQALDWVDPNAIRLDESEYPIAPGGGSLLPAALPPLRWLRISDKYRISNIQSSDRLDTWLSNLRQELAKGLKMVQFREPNWQGDQDSLFQSFKATVDLCHRYFAKCLINSVHPQEWWQKCDGTHLRAADAATVLANDTRPPGKLGVSAHNIEDLEIAKKLHADFVVLGHVAQTNSHPNDTPMGWDNFYTLAQQAQRPVFAIGGQSTKTFEQARLHGAHGIAAISGQLFDNTTLGSN